jgi:hypothetical protein
MNSRQGEQMHQPARGAIGKVVLDPNRGEGQVVPHKSHHTWVVVSNPSLG